MGPTLPAALPPVTAEYASTLQRAEGQVPSAPSAHRFSRAADGKTRVDSGSLSVISNPATAQTILLDHVKKTATMQPGPSAAPPAAGMPQMPLFSPPRLPGQPPSPDVKVEDLGKSFLQGHEVEGKRFVTQPPALPKPPTFQIPGAPATPQMSAMPSAPKPPQIPGMPPLPAAPKIPGMPPLPAGLKIPGTPPLPAGLKVPGMSQVPAAPKMSGAPPAPAAPQTPTTTEVWNSTRMGVPMLMKMSGGFGQLTQVCHSAVPGEPHPSAFQIPPGYKVIGGA